MWRKLPKEQEQGMLLIAIEFTGDHIKYGNAMKQVIYEWPRTMLNTITNLNINRRAFLGHCACQLVINCPEYITRQAWHELTDKQRYLADKVAQQTIDKWCAEYERKNRIIHSDMAEQMLLWRDS
jgi:hypothetical protein